MERTGVIIVAGGSGSRAGGARPKQFRFLGGMPVLARTINTFAAALPGAEIVAVLPEQHIGFWKNLSARFDVAEHKIAAGGAERFHSVRNGLAALTSDPGLIAVQDGVRPLGSVAMIRRVAEAAAKHGAAIPVVEPVCLAEGERENLKLTTPGDFVIAEALIAAREETENEEGTTDAEHV